MEATDITIWGSTSFVLGFGRTGITLARMLKGIGAKTYVAARKPSDLVRIEEQGYIPVEFKKLAQEISKADFIFNTAPALVLPREILKLAKKTVYILDLASAPGGVDFDAAKELELTAVLAPGLPGKVAPKTAGEILARKVPELVWKALQD
jgi:dipicolinate synthase subunit A